MSLDVSLVMVQPTEVFTQNITHNLNKMAQEAGIYEALWRPEEVGIKKASQLIKPLKEGLALMKSDPARFKKFDADLSRGLRNTWPPVRNTRTPTLKSQDRR